MPVTFNGVLRANEVFAPLFNMIISQEPFANPIAKKSMKLVDQARVDGSLYGDTKLYISTDALRTYNWPVDRQGQQDLARQLLTIWYPPEPKVQKITLNVFRQIRLTLDQYLTKRGWMGESPFTTFNGVMLSWIGTTKDIYDSTQYNTAVGTKASAKNAQNVTITLPAIADGATNAETEAHARLSAMSIATEMADLMVQLGDYSRDYNDNGFLRSYDESDLIFVWNSDFVNKIKHFDLPTIFHSESLIKHFAEDVLPPRYFGTVNTVGGTTSANNLTVRSLDEADYGDVHVFAGDLLPGNTAYDGNTTYTEDHTIAFKVMHKSSMPYMSAMEVGSSFYNPIVLKESHFLTIGRNTLDYLAEYPMITVKVVEGA